MKLAHLALISTIGAAAFALMSTGASAETYNFGEGQSSMSGASRHAPAPKHPKHKKTKHSTSADKGAYSHP
jgi:hypothetical protein